MTARPITVDMDAIVDAEFLEPDGMVDTDVFDAEHSAQVTAALSLRDADRVALWTRVRIARSIRERGVAMNAEMLAAMVESGAL
jgi:hypothetical protein